jgi:hypothetical protein
MDSYKNQLDKAQITIALTDWNGTFRINTTDGKFVDFNSPEIIAYGRLESDKSYSDYVEFTIPLEYRYTDKTPKYIIISAAAAVIILLSFNSVRIKQAVQSSLTDCLS